MVNMRGLIIKPPWIDLILDGEKIWEIRGNNTNVRGKIYLIKSGTKQIFGTVELIDSKPLSYADYIENEDKHCISVCKENKLPYKKTYAWVLKNPIQFEKPIPYSHPRGAIIWVKLDGRIKHGDTNKKEWLWERKIKNSYGTFSVPKILQLVASFLLIPINAWI